MSTESPGSTRDHWNHAYLTKGAQGVSWYQREPTVSLELIAHAGIARDAGIIDVGGGSSVLVDRLLDAGFGSIAVLDVSDVALGLARLRLGNRAVQVEWFEADVGAFDPPHRYALWHDRAVFHFLTGASDRRNYLSTLRHALTTGGTVVISTFAVEGPPKCSGLDVVRYDEHSLLAEFGSEFDLVEAVHESHRTPWGTEQRFIYCRMTWRG